MKRIQILSIPLLLAVLFFQSSFTSQDDKAIKILKDAKQKINSLEDFSAAFSYVLKTPGENARQFRKNGSIDYKKGKYKVKLEDQEIYYNGNTIWVYLPLDSEVNILDGNSEETPGIEYLFNLLEAESAKARYDGEENIDGVKCHKIYLSVSDPKVDYNQATIWINAKTNMFKKFVTIDRRQSKTTYTFDQFKLNQGLSNSFFTFEITDEMDVYDER